MQKFKQQHKVEWEHLLFDFDFLKHFGYEHWSEMSRYPEQVGYLLNKENRIEIKLKSKLITRFFAHELMNLETLFPLYQTSFTELNVASEKTNTTFLLQQFEKGLIGKFKFEAEQFSIDQLTFSILNLNNLYVLNYLEVGGKRLVKISDDSLVTGVLVHRF